MSLFLTAPFLVKVPSMGIDEGEGQGEIKWQATVRSLFDSFYNSSVKKVL